MKCVKGEHYFDKDLLEAITGRNFDAQSLIDYEDRLSFATLNINTEILEDLRQQGSIVDFKTERLNMVLHQSCGKVATAGFILSSIVSEGIKPKKADFFPFFQPRIEAALSCTIVNYLVGRPLALLEQHVEEQGENFDGIIRLNSKLKNGGSLLRARTFRQSSSQRPTQ